MVLRKFSACNTHLVKWYHISLPSCRRGFDSLNAYFCFLHTLTQPWASGMQAQAVEGLARDGATAKSAEAAEWLSSLTQRVSTQLLHTAAAGMGIPAGEHLLSSAEVRT